MVETCRHRRNGLDYQEGYYCSFNSDVTYLALGLADNDSMILQLLEFHTGLLARS